MMMTDPYVQLGRQGKIILNGGDEGNIFDTSITFYNAVTRAAAWPFDVKLATYSCSVFKK